MTDTDQQQPLNYFSTNFHIWFLSFLCYTTVSDKDEGFSQTN